MQIFISPTKRFVDYLIMQCHFDILTCIQLKSKCLNFSFSPSLTW